MVKLKLQLNQEAEQSLAIKKFTIPGFPLGIPLDSMKRINNGLFGEGKTPTAQGFVITSNRKIGLAVNVNKNNIVYDVRDYLFLGLPDDVALSKGKEKISSYIDRLADELGWLPLAVESTSTPTIGFTQKSISYTWERDGKLIHVNFINQQGPNHNQSHGLIIVTDNNLISN